MENIKTMGSKNSVMYESSSIKCFGRLGMPINISPKSNISFLGPGFKKEFYVETVTVLIGIGKDHTAELVMTREAWEALNRGEEVSIDTNKEFTKKYFKNK